MKKIIFILLFAPPFGLIAQTAKIKIDINRTMGEIDPKIYGVFMEPIHFNGSRMGLPDTVEYNTLYGNLYNPESPLANENGFRKDYIEAMKELKITNMRWPGGNYAMAYNWKDGIGPKDKRPKRVNLAWGSEDNNHVGTDEWIELNKAMGSENVIGVNLGLGNIEDAYHWVEYCNYNNGTQYSDLRIKYGHERPYNIRIWGLGNEVDGYPWELGYKNAEDYVKVAREAAKAMRAVDNTIELVASGSSYYESTGKWVEWNRKVLAGLGDMVKYISIHAYWNWGAMPDYYTFMGDRALEFEEKIQITANEIENVRVMKNFKNPIYITVDEWGVFGRNFLSVLPVAQCFNSFIRHADIVKMSNYTLMTSLLSSDNVKGKFKSPLYYTFKLFSNNCLGNSVDTYVECDTFSTERYKDIPFLDVTTVFAKETGIAYINIVNRHKKETINADIISSSGSFIGKVKINLITADSLDEQFTFDKQENYKPVTQEFPVIGEKINYSFPPHSFAQIQVSMDNSK